jgi:Mce-associated membrane protein
MLGLLGVFVPKVIGDDDTYGGTEREKVISRARDFATAYNTYDVAQLADYQKRLKGLLTPEYDEQFVQITDAVFKAIKSKKQKSGEAKVRGVAIESIDEDSAETIVAVDATITNTDNKAAVVRHFRWKVSFTKSGEDWRVSNFESVAAVTATAGDPTTPAPSATATEGDK